VHATLLSQLLRRKHPKPSLENKPASKLLENPEQRIYSVISTSPKVFHIYKGNITHISYMT
jgi:hypothetical protein